MSNLYDKIRHDVEFRKEVAEKASLGSNFRPESPLLDRMDRMDRMDRKGPKRQMFSWL